MRLTRCASKLIAWLVLLAAVAPASAQMQGPAAAAPSRGAPLAERVTWHDGTRVREAWVNPMLLAEFPASASRGRASADGARDSAVKAADASAKVVASGGRNMRLWRVADSHAALRALKAAPGPAGFSHVLHDGNHDGTAMRALPGNVVVGFKPTWTRAEVDGWLTVRKLSVVRRIDIAGNYYLIASPPGLESLELANSIHATGEVVFAMPNWWQEIGLN